MADKLSCRKILRELVSPLAASDRPRVRRRTPDPPLGVGQPQFLEQVADVLDQQFHLGNLAGDARHGAGHSRRGSITVSAPASTTGASIAATRHIGSTGAPRRFRPTWRTGRGWRRTSSCSSSSGSSRSCRTRRPFPSDCLPSQARRTANCGITPRGCRPAATCCEVRSGRRSHSGGTILRTRGSARACSHAAGIPPRSDGKR